MPNVPSQASPVARTSTRHWGDRQKILRWATLTLLLLLAAVAASRV